MKRVVLPLVALVAFGCSEAPTEVALDVEPQFGRGGGGIVHSVRGSGHITSPVPAVAGAKRVFSFTAKEHADGTVSGQFQVNIKASAFGSENPAITRVEAEVVCLSVVGNRAWVGGVVKSSSVPAWVGNETGWAVEDNGEGRSSGDLISLAFVPRPPGLAQRVCDRQTLVPNRPVEGGNVQVR